MSRNSFGASSGGCCAFRACAVAVILSWASSSARAADAAYTGAASNVWNNAANWSPNTIPGSGDAATFDFASANNVLDLSGGVTAKSITFDSSGASAYTVGSGPVNGQTLVLNAAAAVTVNPSVSNNQLFNSAVTLGTDATASTYTFTNNSLANTLTFAGSLTGGAGGTAGTKSLTIGGTGNVVLSGALSKGGGSTLIVTDVGSGTLTLSGGGTITNLHLNGGPGSIVNIGNAALTITSSNAGGQALTSSTGGTVNGTGSITLQGGAGSNYGDNFSAAGTTLTVNARLTGASGFEMFGDSGTIALSNNANDFAGDVILNAAGTLRVAHDW